MSCAYEARPAASVEWTYADGEPLSQDVFIFSTTETRKGEYTITESVLTWKEAGSIIDRWNSRGIVKCAANNGGDVVESDSAALNVECRLQT